LNDSLREKLYEISGLILKSNMSDWKVTNKLLKKTNKRILILKPSEEIEYKHILELISILEKYEDITFSIKKSLKVLIGNLRELDYSQEIENEIKLVEALFDYGKIEYGEKLVTKYKIIEVGNIEEDEFYKKVLAKLKKSNVVYMKKNKGYYANVPYRIALQTITYSETNEQENIEIVFENNSSIDMPPI